MITKEDGLAKCNNAGRTGASAFANAERGIFDDQPDGSEDADARSERTKRTAIDKLGIAD